MSKSIKPVNLIFGILYSLAIVFGFQCEYFGEINLHSYKTYIFIVVLAAIATYFSKITWEYISDRISNGKRKEKYRYVGRIQFVSTMIIWMCYFVTFLGVYPGFFVYDAQEELTEVIARTFHNGQPLFHVFTLGGIIQAVHKITGEYNSAIAVYTFIQMTVIAIVLGYVVKKLSDEGFGSVGAILFSLYLGLFPVLNMFALCSAKDGYFVAALLIVFIQIRKLIANPDTYWNTKRNYIMLAASSVIMMLFRSNGIHAYVIFALISISYFWKKTDVKKLMLLFAISILIVIGANKGAMVLTKASDVGHREILTVPIQQLARVYDYDFDSLSSEQRAAITKYIPEDALKRYNPKCSDMVKIEFNENAYRDDSTGFYKVWAEVFTKHPVAYLDALFMTSYGLWYPQATLDGYKGNTVFTFTYGDSSYFGYEVEEPGYRDSKIPVIDHFYRYLSLDPAIHHVPVIRFLFSPGFMLWVMLFLLGYFIYLKRYNMLIPYLLPLIVILTCFIGPMSLVRYSFYLWILVPIAAVDIVNTKENA